MVFGKRRIEQDVDVNGRKVGEVKHRELWVEKVKEGPVGFAIDMPWNEHSASFISDYDAEDRQRSLGLAPPIDTTYDDLDNRYGT